MSNSMEISDIHEGSANVMKVWLYCRAPRGSEKTLLKQEKQLALFAEQRGYEVVGISHDKKYHPSISTFLTSELKKIVEIASRGKIDAVLITDISVIANGKIGVVADFNFRLNDYGVSIFDLVKPDEPYQSTLVHLQERAGLHDMRMQF